MNPEFKRNCWLQLTTSRLVTIPSVLAILLLTYYVNTHNNNPDFFTFGVTLFCFAGVWGAFSVGHSVFNERKENTWDQQRMNAISPWTMTWGKLFGSSAGAWYGGAICLVVMIVASVTTGTDKLVYIAILISSTVFLSALFLLSALYAIQNDSRIGSGVLGIVALILLLQLIGIASSIGLHSNEMITWYDKPWDRLNFILATITFFACSTVFAAWRLMRTALQVRTLPWALPLFILLLSGWLTGFSDEAFVTKFSFFVFIAGILITYASLFSEENGITIWRRIVARAKAAQWQNMFEELPLWPMTLMLMIPAGIVLTIQTAAAQADSVAADVVFAVFPHAVFAIIVLLLVIRDVAIILFFSFAVRPRRVFPKALGIIVLLNFILPTLIGWSVLVQLVQDAWFILIIAAIQMAIAIHCVLHRWSNYRLQPAG